MQNPAHPAISIVLLTFLATSWGQAVSRPTASSSTAHRSDAGKEAALNSDERLALLASALDSKNPRYAERDCSHLVHAIYERAGFPYAYASSDDLYDGVNGFMRVGFPQTGDLVVWHGHVGIVVRPSRHVFYSFLHAGPGISDYQSSYWASRGQARFYRYRKDVRYISNNRSAHSSGTNHCTNCSIARSN